MTLTRCAAKQTRFFVEWYRMGEKNKDDSFTRFFMHWVAFNGLYSEVGSDKTERQQILSFYKREEPKFDKFDALSTADCQIFMERPVLNMSGANNPYISQKSRENWETLRCETKPRHERVKALLMMLYQVRCNLFHGKKNPQEPRDLTLITASANILQGYVRALLDIDEE